MSDPVEIHWGGGPRAGAVVGAAPTQIDIQVVLGSPQLQTTSVWIPAYTGQALFVKYQGLPANQPHSFQNFVAVWEASIIPWRKAPLAQDTVPQDNESGSFTVTNLQITQATYIVGYGVGPAISDICASAVISAGGLVTAPSSVQIEVKKVGTNFVDVSYQTLVGYRPLTSGNWIGLWPGQASPYDGLAPLATAAVPADWNQGTVRLAGVDLTQAPEYTLVYFMGGKDKPLGYTQAAAILTFSTSGG